jgi:CheY-like chemotaxis protein
MWLTSEVGTGTTFFCSLPIEKSASSEAETADKGSRRWFSEYGRYEARTREFKAPPPQVPPLFIVLGSGDNLPQLMRAYADKIDVFVAPDIEAAAQELEQTSAQALIVNGASTDDVSRLKNRLSAMPFPPPIISCWVPGKDEAAAQLGVVRYLVKPVTKQKLLTLMEELGQPDASVLLVDDQPEMLQLFARMLSSAGLGYHVLQATSGRRALALMRERRPSMVLLDLIMPGMDGFQLLQDKSRDPLIKDIPVVAVSSRDPSGTPIITDTLTVTRANGLSAREIMACIQVISGILTRSAQPADPAQPGTPPA